MYVCHVYIRYVCGVHVRVHICVVYSCTHTYYHFAAIQHVSYYIYDLDILFLLFFCLQYCIKDTPVHT